MEGRKTEKKRKRTKKTREKGKKKEKETKGGGGAKEKKKVGGGWVHGVRGAWFLRPGRVGPPSYY